jgi:hypothetical protein
MTFADQAENSAENTEREIADLLGGRRPRMPDLSYAFAGAEDAEGETYIGADVFNAFVISSDVPEIPSFDPSTDIALLPVRVRLKVSRWNSPAADRWDRLENAEDVLGEFANGYAIWVRSPNATERDMNLFQTLRNRGVSIADCVQAFTYGDYLYLDFSVFIADARSPREGKTAFGGVVRDDGIPYALLADGKTDNAWTLSFFIASNNYSLSDDPGSVIPDNPVTSGEDGGGCDSGFISAFSLLALAIPLVAVRGIAR